MGNDAGSTYNSNAGGSQGALGRYMPTQRDSIFQDSQFGGSGHGAFGRARAEARTQPVQNGALGMLSTDAMPDVLAARSGRKQYRQQRRMQREPQAESMLQGPRIPEGGFDGGGFDASRTPVAGLTGTPIEQFFGALNSPRSAAPMGASQSGGKFGSGLGVG